MNEIQSLIKSLEGEIKNVANEEYKAEALLRLQEIARTYAGEDKLVSSLELYELIRNETPQRRLLTGIAGLDAILEGFRESQLIVLSGITKHGKTSLAIELTICLKDEHPMWLPFEEPARELILKFHDRGEPPPVFYTPQKMVGNTLLWIEKKIIEAKAKFDSKVVFIDHLHYILNGNRENMAQEIGDTMRSLKKLAVKWNVVIVLLAHLKKTKLDQNPDLEDLKDSSSIAQEADTVMFMWRETKRERGEVITTNNINLSVQANRRTGKTGNVKLVFKNGRFKEEDWQFDGLPVEQRRSWSD